MEDKIDARGLACPQPVIMTKKALADVELDTLTVRVDNRAAVENVTRFAASSGCEAVTHEHAENDFEVSMTRTAVPAATVRGDIGRNKVVFINTNQLGQGESELGELLAKAFTYALTEVDNKPQTLVLMNKGVTLAVEGSDSLENLQILEQQHGVTIMVCGTCLDYYGLIDQLRVGTNANMYVIAEAFLAADSVVTL